VGYGNEAEGTASQVGEIEPVVGVGILCPHAESPGEGFECLFGEKINALIGCKCGQGNSS
jgi:hypothetical protein